MRENLEKKLSVLAGTVTESPKAAQKLAQLIAELFAQIDAQKLPEAFAEALSRGDAGSAVRECAAYFRNRPDKHDAFRTNGRTLNLAWADDAVNGIMHETRRTWTFPDGRIRFLYDITEIQPPRNYEWVWQLNRHTYWWHMASAYLQTGDEKYARAFHTQLLDWLEQTDCPENWNAPGSAWRTIECGIRLFGSWPHAFTEFRKSQNVSDIALLAMLSSMHRQAKHLIAHPTGGNWLMMECNGIIATGVLIPELTDAHWLRVTALERFVAEMDQQVLPDGMHYELSPDYFGVTWNCACNVYDLAVKTGFADEIPPRYAEQIRRMANAAMRLTTPGMILPLTNDCHYVTAANICARTGRLLGDCAEYRYFTSNRTEGNPPEGATASDYLPWAGFAVMRSDRGADATYLCFDVGPLGKGHMHQDKLSFCLYKGDEQLLFDDGGGEYEISPAREYGMSGYDHNTVLVDGMAEVRWEPKIVSDPIDANWQTTADFDSAEGTYDDTFSTRLHDQPLLSPAVWHRQIRYYKPDLFVVTDTLTSRDGEAHDYELLFQFNCTHVKKVDTLEGALLSDCGKKYDVYVIPLGENIPDPVLVSARTEPDMRGWFVGRNEDILRPAVTASYTVKRKKDCVFRTLLLPVKAGAAAPEILCDGNTVTVRTADHTYSFNI